MKIENDKDSYLRVEDFPYCTLLLVASVFLTVLIGFFGNYTDDLFFLILVSVMMLATILLSKKRIAIVDTVSKEVKLTEIGLVKKDFYEVISFDDIEAVLLSQGKGTRRHSGKVLLKRKLNLPSVVVCGQDICFGRTRKLKNLVKKMEVQIGLKASF